jgi:hypothetical protein
MSDTHLFAERQALAFYVYQMIRGSGLAPNERAANEWMRGTITKRWVSRIPPCGGRKKRLRSLSHMWRVFTQSAPHTAHPNQLRPIHPQRRHCCPASRCQSDNLRTVVAPREMVSPIIFVGMKQRDFLLRDRIPRHPATRLVSIARRARQAEILELRLASCRSRKNVFKFKNRDRQILPGLAIGTSIRKPNANLPLKICRDVDSQVRDAPAWSCCRVYFARVLRTVSWSTRFSRRSSSDTSEASS